MAQRLLLLMVLILGVSPVFGAPFIIGDAANTGIGTWVFVACPATSSCAAATPGSPVATYEPASPQASWLANSATSQWITPAPPAPGNEIPGFYTYRMTFDLTGFQPGTATLTFRAAADDLLSNVLINNTSTGVSFIGFGEWHPTLAPGSYTISSNFVAGVNTLDFIVENMTGVPAIGNSPTGLRVEILSAEADEVEVVVPEPASLGLMGLGLIGLATFRIRRRKKA